MLKNAKHEAFAQAVALGASAAEAYRREFPDAAPKSVEACSSRLAANAKVKLRIEELRKKVEESAEKKFDLTKDKWLERLLNASKSADSTAGEVSALREIGKAVGWYVPEQTESKLEIVIRKL